LSFLKIALCERKIKSFRKKKKKKMTSH